MIAIATTGRTKSPKPTD